VIGAMDWGIPVCHVDGGGYHSSVERLEIVQDAADRRQCEAEAKQQTLLDEWEFIRLSHRNAQLATSLTAAHQRERASLQVPLMKLYAALNPTSIYKWNDDFDVVLRAGRRKHC